MALTVDSSTSFPAGGSGYSFSSSEVEFVDGVASLVEGFIGWSTIQTPVIDTSGWSTINSVTVQATEALGAYMRFLVSFDGGTTYQAYSTAGWRPVPLSEIATRGNPREVLEGARQWPETDDLNFAVAIARADGASGTAEIDAILVSHGTQVLTLAGEPDGNDILEPADPSDGPFILPDFALARRVEQEGEMIPLENGYSAHLPRATFTRSSFDARWEHRTEAEKDGILAFLLDHQDEAFVWDPPQLPRALDVDSGLDDFEDYAVASSSPRLAKGEGWERPKRFIADEPEVQIKDVGVYSVSCKLLEVRPTSPAWRVGRNYTGLSGLDDYEEYSEGDVGPTNQLRGGDGYLLQWQVSQQYAAVLGLDDMEAYPEGAAGTLNDGKGFLGAYALSTL